jgi:FAD-dependent urate hydroxylase
MPKAVIAGAGVAGSVAGIALRKAGWEVDVYEPYQRSAGLSQGAFLTVAVNGLDALRAVEADHVVRRLGFPTGNIRFLTGSGKDLGRMAIGPRLADGTVTRTVKRSDLYAALYDLAVERGVVFRHGARLLDSQRGSPRVQARFSDGTTANGDVLIGADGLHSEVRRRIDPAAPGPRYTGLRNVGARTRTDRLDVSAEATDGDYRMIWGRRCFFGYTVSPDGEIWWFANPHSGTEPTADQLLADGQAALRDRLIEQLRGDRGPAADIVAGTDGPILHSNQYDLPAVPQWHRNGMVIIGDAAHAVSPSTGQGVSLACEDAVTLALCLRDEINVDAALTRYAKVRRDRVDRVTAWGAKMGANKSVGPVGRVIRDLVLPHILARGSTPEAMRKQAWLFDHHIDWAYGA